MIGQISAQTSFEPASVIEFGFNYNGVNWFVILCMVLSRTSQWCRVCML